jgi:hypothetical protein
VTNFADLQLEVQLAGMSTLDGRCSADRWWGGADSR